MSYARPHPSVTFLTRRPVRIETEVARTVAEQRQGLMHRRWLAPGTGMLFVSERPVRYRIWMRNTFIPLDIIFINAGRVVNVAQNTEPLTDDEHSSRSDAQFALEVNAGTARRHGIVSGTGVLFEGLGRNG